MAQIRIPTPLRPFANGQAAVAVQGETVGAALNDLTGQYPDLRPHLFDGPQLRSFVNIYLNQEDVRYLQGAETPLQAADTLLIIPSIAGGAV
ncbi:MAG: MoaD/ThiS family protein [Anaerolineae bacterium]|nr:MoaD/ThiS family protein [Anaerolineae bacterium]